MLRSLRLRVGTYPLASHQIAETDLEMLAHLDPE